MPFNLSQWNEITILATPQYKLKRLNVGCSRAFLTHAFGVANFLAIMQRLEAVYFDFREVCEQIIAAVVRGDETKAFCVIEKFNGTGFHYVFLYLMFLRANARKSKIIKE